MIKGKNPTLLKVQYIRPDRKNNIKECFQVLYIDDHGRVQYAEEPADVDIFIVKPEFRTYTYNKPQERIDHMERIRCKYSNIRKVIADHAGDWGKAIVDKSFEVHDQRYLNQLFAWPYCFGCDFQPEYYFMKQWYEKYPLTKPHLTKAYLDIEIDQMDYITDLSNPRDTAYAPVNCVTVILEETMESFTFILEPYLPPKMNRTPKEYDERYNQYKNQLSQYETLMNERKEFIKVLHDTFDETYGVFDYHLRSYKQEIDLIADVFNLINTRKPNFCMIWNMRFDIQYLLARIRVLGYDPKSIVCSPELPNPRAFFTEDKSSWQIEKQYDSFTVTAFTQYICQERNYASIRKSQHKLRSVSLNAISTIELKDKKVDYQEYGNIIKFPYENFGRYVLYNIKDVLLQYGIEKKVNDIMTMWNRSMSNITPYNKMFRETYLLRNVRELYFERDEGLVQSNNLNTLKVPEEDETAKKFYGMESEDDLQTEVEKKASFKGAINAEPKMNDRVGELVAGYPSNNVFINCMDFDMGAFYPSVKIVSNLDSSTLLYKASFNNEEYKSGQFLNRSQNQTYEETDKNGKLRKNDFTGEAVHGYCSGNIATVGYAYLGLPTVTEVYEEIKKRMNKQ